MRRTLFFPCLLCLAIGLLLGILLPVNWSGREAAPGGARPIVPIQQPQHADASTQTETLDSADNSLLLGAACAVAQALEEQDYTALSGFVHPERGVTFTPYSTVDPENDLTFTPAQIKNLAQDETVYTWGFEDGRGTPIRMTIPQYLERYVTDRDYTRAPQIGIDQILTGGNALENLAEVYTGCRFVDFTFPSADPVNNGLDWSSLKLVFQAGEHSWLLVGVVHGEWTI